MSNNRLGTMPIGKLLVYMSVPTMFSMLIQALYNIVDSIFVARFSETALTAVSIAFPLQMMLFAFAIGMNTGTCSVISRRLGAGKEKEASLAAETGYTVDLCLYLLFVLIGLFLSRPFVGLYVSDPELSGMSVTYLRICLCLSVGVYIATFCEKTLQATGDTIHPMIIQGSGAIFNIIMDPILIFGYFGLPAMGVKGAAIATVMGQCFSMLLGIFFLKRNKYIKFRFTNPRMDKDSISDILKVGLPSIVMQGIGTIMTAAMNAIVITFNVLATTAFGVYFKLQSFVFMPVFGLNSGLMPIVGYNYGARNRKRMMDALKLGLVVAFTIMTTGTIVFNLFPDALLSLFNASADMMAIGERCLKTISLSFPIASISIIMISLFQAKGDGYLSMIVSIIRQIVVLIPSAWLLGHFFGLDAVWYAFVIAEVVALTVSSTFFRMELKRIDF